MCIRDRLGAEQRVSHPAAPAGDPRVRAYAAPSPDLQPRNRPTGVRFLTPSGIVRRRRRTVPSGKPFAVRELSPPGPRRTVFCRRIFCRMAFRTADSAVRIFVVSRNLPVAGRLCFSGFVCRVSACCGCWRSVSTFAALLRLDRMGPWGPVPGFGWTPSVPDCAGLFRTVVLSSVSGRWQERGEAPFG